jgi:hypothetical protein
MMEMGNSSEGNEHLLLGEIRARFAKAVILDGGIMLTWKQLDDSVRKAVLEEPKNLVLLCTMKNLAKLLLG